MGNQSKGMPLGGLISVQGKTYRPMVLRIEDHYDDGRIKTLQLIHDDQVADLSDPAKRHFTVALMNVEMVKETN